MAGSAQAIKVVEENDVPAEWVRATVQELIDDGSLVSVQDGNHGGNYPKAEEFADTGIPLITGADIESGVINLRTCKFLKPESAERLRIGFAKTGDVLLSHKGTMGKTAIVPALSTPYVILNPQLTHYRVSEQGTLDRQYLKYFFDSPLFQSFLARISGMSTISTLSLSVQKSLEICFPKKAQQRAIAHILGTLDDKIELNRRMSETLEAMARALFKSWFVDFDPVRWKMERKGAKAQSRNENKTSLASSRPGDFAFPPALADLFPDSFEDSELGEIPRGWGVKPSAEMVEIIGGGTPKTSVPEYWNGEIPWFSVVDAPRESDVWVLDTEKKITQAGLKHSSTQILPVGTTIISARGTVGRVALVGVPMAMNQSCYGLRGKMDSNGFHTFFATRELVAHLQQHAYGSVFDTITRNTLAGISVTAPTAALVEAFEKQVAPSLQRIRAGLLESRTLAALRDALLPKLISGELRVKDAEKIIEREDAMAQGRKGEKS